MTAASVIRSPVTVVVEMQGEITAKGRARAYIDDDDDVRIKFRTPKKTRTYEKALKLAALVAMRRAKRKELKGPLAMVVIAYLPVPPSWSKVKRAKALAGEIRPTSKPDWDNAGKIASDALNKTVYRDDAQITDGRAIKLYSDRPRIYIEVTEIFHHRFEGKPA